MFRVLIEFGPLKKYSSLNHRDFDVHSKDNIELYVTVSYSAHFNQIHLAVTVEKGDCTPSSGNKLALRP